MLQFVIHVAPQNLRTSEVDNEDLPVWVIRPLADLTQSAIVYGISVTGGTTDTCAMRHDPLPGTAGHGWAYLRTSADATVSVKRTATSFWESAESLFSGACCSSAAHPIFKRAVQTVTDNTSDDSPSVDVSAVNGETPDQTAFDAESPRWHHVMSDDLPSGSVSFPGVTSGSVSFVSPVADHLRGPSW